ncbi:MAG: hypothetical protein ACOYBP_09120 [Microbacteriaceae bacterium]
MSNSELKARALEPSTWRGLGGLLMVFGLASAGQIDAVVAVGTALMALVEVFRREAQSVPVAVPDDAPVEVPSVG